MTDPNSETTESADSNQETNTTITTSKAPENEAAPASTPRVQDEAGP